MIPLFGIFLTIIMMINKLRQIQGYYHVPKSLSPSTLLSHTLSMSTIKSLPSFSGSLSVEESKRADRCVDFINASPDPFHCVQTISTQLNQQGFQKLYETVSWKNHLLPGGKYYFIRGGSSIVAFTVGKEYQPGNGFKILGAHTDSPNLKIKPKSKRGIQSHMIQLNVECYGGGLWNTWFDRDLSISGRVFLYNPETKEYNTRLIHLKDSILRIPSLCIHLRSIDERENQKIDKENHLQPILAHEILRQMNQLPEIASGNQGLTTSNPWKEAQEPILLQYLAKELQVDIQSIVDFELSLYDTQPIQRTGITKEYICGARLDNLASCFSIMEAFVDHSHENHLTKDSEISVMALFDHEEVGSESIQGAGSTLISDTIDRITEIFLTNQSSPSSTASASIQNYHELKLITSRNSFLLSVDMAHAIHPNYPNKHEKSHSPMMNHGIVIKSNANQRYSTNGISGFLTRELARMHQIPIQEFAVRNDCPCGSTIGPILSTQLGIRAVDLGMPQLSMHSIREMMGGKDLSYAYQLFGTFLSDFKQIDQSLKID